ncbi:hypothetical protein [Halomarina pelagica]|nr:hypothetical protein [Halomarina sp. BND7]
MVRTRESVLSTVARTAPALAGTTPTGAALGAGLAYVGHRIAGE